MRELLILLIFPTVFLLTEKIERAKAEAVEDMIAEGVLDDAREYAVRIITQFMLALGFEEVRIK